MIRIFKIDMEAEKNHKKTFYLNDGKTLSSIKSLAIELTTMPKRLYKHHVNREKNDFSNWIEHSMKNKTLSEKIEGQISRIEMELKLLRHIVHESKILNKTKKPSININKKKKN